MNDFCCSFQSANGINPETIINISSNDNILFSSNINFVLSNSIYFSSNNNISFSSNINSNLSNIIYNGSNNDNSNISNIYYNTGFIDSNLLWWRYELMGTQAELVVQKANQTILSTQQTLMSATLSTNSITLIEHGARLDNLEEDLNNNYFTKNDTSNIFVSSNFLSNNFITSNLHSNTSNTLANYNNLYNIPNELTNISNIFVSSNVLSNTSNTLANYNNLYNRPNIFTKEETSNVFTTSNHINTNFYNKSQIDDFNTYKPMTSNITQKLTGSILSITLVNGGSGYPPNLTNQPLTFTKGGGQNASGTYNTNASGSVSSVSLTDGGILYTSTLVEVKAGTGNAVISATMGYFDFHNVYSALNVSGKPDIVYERADLAFGTRNPNGISYQENPDGSAGALGTNKFCGLRVKDERTFLIANSNMLLTSFNNSYINASSNIILQANTCNIELSCINNNAKIKMLSNTIFEKEVSFKGAVSKKIPKYFITSRTANFDGISCLAFDINLQTSGVSTTTITGFNFRLFKIYFWFIDKAPRFQHTPRSYDITMSSFDAEAVSAFDGFGGYSSLDKAYSYQWFLYRQNFSQISFCCPTGLFGNTHLTVGYVIQDLLAE